jgi:PKD repeat protein
VWNGSNAKDRIYNCASELEINESCLVVPPGFRDTKNNDYSLSSASGLVDQGATYEDTGATSETDLAGNARLVDNVDIGCYEYTKADLDVGFTASVSEGLVPMTVEFTASVFGAKGDVSYDWDFDNDGKVDETTTTPTVSYVYQTAGVKTIGLTITSGGATARATLIDAIKVSPVVVFADSANAENAAFPYDTLETATPDLALAIATAGNGSKILVADGTYTATGTYGFEVSKDLRIESISGNPANCILSAQGNGTHRAMSLNHPSALVAGLTMQDGYISDHAAGATLLFRDLGGVVSNCVIKLGSARGWDGDGALASVSTSGRITHSILEQGLCHGDQQADQKTSCLKILGQVDNCLIRDCNRGADNQNIVMVYAGGKLLNCTIVDGLCNTTTRDGRTTDCVGVRADTGARVENCVIVGVRHQESDETFSVRAWNGDAAAFVNCATDTTEPINGTCVTVTTAAFSDYTAKDYRPASGSPLIGKGKKNELADGTDLVGNRRASGAMDIGCYEAKSGFIVYVH